MMQASLAAAFAFVTFFTIGGLVAYRLLWAAPSLAQLGVLPRGWRRWIFDEHNERIPTS